MEEEYDQQPEDDQTTVVKDKAYWLNITKIIFESSSDYFDAYIRPEVERGIRYFQNRFPADSKYLTDSYKLKAKVFRPKVRSAIRKNEATAAAAFFSTEDVVSVRPVDDNNPIHKNAADVYRYLLQNRLSGHPNAIPWFQTVLGAYQEAQVNKVVASIQEWEYDPERGIDRPRCTLIPIENLRIDPAADWTDPVNSSPYITQMIPMYVKDVKAKIRAGKWLPVSEQTMLQARTDQNDSTRQTREGKADSKDSPSGINDYTIVWVHRNFVSDEGQELVYYSLGIHELLTMPVPLKELYFHGRRPIVIGRAILEAHKAYPSSFVDLVRVTADEINDLASQRMENIKLCLSKRYTARRNKNVDLRSITRNVAGSVTMVDAHEDVKVMDIGDVTSSSYQEQDRLNLDFDDAAGGFSGSSVASNRKLNETVGGMNILSNNANIVSEYQLRTFVETWVEPVLRQMVMLEREYESDESIVSLAGQSAGLDQVTEEMLQQEVILTVNVGIGNTNPQNQVERFAYGLTTLKNIFGPEVLKKIQLAEVTKELFGKLGYRDGARFFNFEDQATDPIQKLTMDKLQAEIDQIRAATHGKDVEAMLKRMETLYSAIQTAQTAATVPGVVPIADELAKSAGFVDQNIAPLIPEPSAPAIAAGEELPGQPDNTSPMFPPRADGPGEGMMHGIETQRNDGTEQI